MPLDNLPVEFLFTMELSTSSPPPVMLPGGPHGSRFVIMVGDGTFKGPKLSGTVTSGGDWATITDSGVIRVDVRLMFHTDDGADILVTYTGVGGTVDGEIQVRSTPRFEVGDDRYKWLNEVQAVGLGKVGGAGVVYDVYALK